MSQIGFGAKFASYDEVSAAISKYEEEHLVKFWKKDAKKLEAVHRSKKKISNAPPELRYYTIQYCCIRGGRKHTSRKSTGTRKTTTFRQGCPALITVTLSDDAHSLEVTAINENHNHEISPELYRSLPRNRRLSPSSKEMVINYWRLGTDMRLVRDKMREETGKLVTLKDIHNIISSRATLKPFDKVVSEEVVCSPEFSTSTDVFIETASAAETLNAIENTPAQHSKAINIKVEKAANVGKPTILTVNPETRKRKEPSTLRVSVLPSPPKVSALGTKLQALNSNTSKMEMSVMETQKKILSALEVQNSLLQKNVENQKILINLETEKNDKLDAVIRTVNTLLVVMAQAHNMEIVNA